MRAAACQAGREELRNETGVRLAGVMFHGVPFLMIITDVYNALEGYYQKERTRLSVMW